MHRWACNASTWRALSEAAAAWLPQHARAYAKQAGNSAAERWQPATRLQMLEYYATPPVPHTAGMPLPTALSWLRRRGPPVPASLLYKLFRRGQVRVMRKGQVARISQGRELQDGDVLMVPQATMRKNAARLDGPSARHLAGGPQAEEPDQWQATAAAKQRSIPCSSSMGHAQLVGDQDDPHPLQQRAPAALHNTPPSSSSTARSRTSQSAMPHATPEAVRSWLLATQRDFFVLNKPAGVAVQGPNPGNLAGVLPEALGCGQQEAPRLVHRLDQRVSGAMLVARGADAAAWLSRALQSKPAAAAEAAAAKQEAERGRQRPKGRVGAEEAMGEEAPANLYVQRTYWALVQGDLQGKRSGRLRSMLHIDGQPKLAVTDYRVRAAEEGIAWLELTPHTGRKHQLRIHCSKLLGAPIIGDYKYGYSDSTPSRQLAPKLTLFLEQSRRRSVVAGQGLALAAAAQLAGLPRDSSSGSSSSTDRDFMQRGDSGRQRSGQAVSGVAGAPLVPIFLHSRSVVVGQPRKAPVRATAPLPRYMKDLVTAMRWKMPPETKPRAPMRSVLVQPMATGVT